MEIPKVDCKTVYWSRRPGKFVDRNTGGEFLMPRGFDGTVSAWYGTLYKIMCEEISDLQKKYISRKNPVLILGEDAETILYAAHGSKVHFSNEALTSIFGCSVIPNNNTVKTSEIMILHENELVMIKVLDLAF